MCTLYKIYLYFLLRCSASTFPFQLLCQSAKFLSCTSIQQRASSMFPSPFFSHHSQSWDRSTDIVYLINYEGQKVLFCPLVLTLTSSSLQFLICLGACSTFYFHKLRLECCPCCIFLTLIENISAGSGMHWRVLTSGKRQWEPERTNCRKT